MRNLLPLRVSKYQSNVVDLLLLNDIGMHIYEDTRFVDSCKFTNSSLDELARNLPVDKFIYLNELFASRPEEDKALIRQKCYCPYSYVDSRARYTEDLLPARDEWTNKMQGGAASVSEKE